MVADSSTSSAELPHAPITSNPNLKALRAIISEADDVASEAGKTALRLRLRRRLERVGAVSELSEIANELGGDPVTRNPLFAADKSGIRRNLVDHLVNALAELAIPDDAGDEGAEDALPPDVLDAWLATSADAWPHGGPGPPTDAYDALDANGRWGAASCGVEVRLCHEAPEKGRGAYATRDIEAGAVVGVYHGEALTQREWSVRHGWKYGEQPTRLTHAEAQREVERKERLERLSYEDGAPMGGAENGGAYVFAALLAATEPEPLPPGMGRRRIYLDAEDGTRSNWTRYINHAHYETPACNLSPRTDARVPRVWFVARRPIKAGEEVCFSYGKVFNDMFGKGAADSDKAVDWHGADAKVYQRA